MAFTEVIKNIFSWLVEKLRAAAGVKSVHLYDSANSIFSPKSKKSIEVVLCILSPTWYIASISNKGLSPEQRKKSLICRNYFYLGSAIFFTILIGSIAPPGYIVHDNVGIFAAIIMSVLLYIVMWGRCNEILFSFISDALDKTEGKHPKSTLTYRKRIELAFLSYIELILNYSILYFSMPKDWFGNKDVFQGMVDAIYFSGVTITTLGYGDFSPETSLPKVLVVQEVLVGFTLIVVSFAIYAGKGLAVDNLKGDASK